MQIEIRTIAEADHPEALDLWETVFQTRRDYFQRCFSDDPWYQDGDSLGAWVDGRLVSTVHLCRRPLAWDDRTLQCGGIANVATLPDYRGRGLSRTLLRQMIDRMARTGIDFSALGTGTPGHYTPLGWEAVDLPEVVVTIDHAVSRGTPLPVEFQAVTSESVSQTLQDLYRTTARKLQLTRPAAYFIRWAAWNWTTEPSLLWEMPEIGYAIILAPAESAAVLRVREWRAADADCEQALFEGLHAWASSHGMTSIELPALPQFDDLSFRSLGTVTRRERSGWMLRNIALPDADYDVLKAWYRSGAACWWSADSF